MSGLQEISFSLTNDTAKIENSTLTCAERSLREQEPITDPSVLLATRIIQAAFYIPYLVCGLFLNSKVIFLVAKYKKLQNLSFAIAVQVAVLDMILCVTLAVVTVSNAMAERWVFGAHMCSIVGVIFLSFSILRTFLMFIFVIDRFLSVFFPFFYPKYKIKFITVLCIGAWIVALAVAFVGYGLDCYRFTAVSWLCNAYQDCSPACATYTNLLYGGIATPVTIIPIILYVILFIKARRLKRKDFLNTSLENIPASYSASEWKATLTFFLLFITVFALTLPNLAVFLAIDLLYEPMEVPSSLHILAVLAVIIISLFVITDPIVIMRNRDVRDITDRFKERIIMKLCPPNQEEDVVETASSNEGP